MYMKYRLGPRGRGMVPWILKIDSGFSVKRGAKETERQAEVLQAGPPKPPLGVKTS